MDGFVIGNKKMVELINQLTSSLGKSNNKVDTLLSNSIKKGCTSTPNKNMQEQSQIKRK